MSVLDFPTQADVTRIYRTMPFDQLNERIFALLNGSISESGFHLPRFKKAIDTSLTMSH